MDDVLSTHDEMAATLDAGLKAYRLAMNDPNFARSAPERSIEEAKAAIQATTSTLIAWLKQQNVPFDPSSFVASLDPAWLMDWRTTGGDFEQATKHMGRGIEGIDLHPFVDQYACTG